MEDKSSKGVSCELSLPRDKSLMMLSMYTKGYPRSHRNKSQSDKKERMWKNDVHESMHGIVLHDVLSKFSC
jgi:hypothetical protein